MSLSNYLEDALLNHIRPGGATLTQPSNLYVKLHTADPGEAGTTAASAETTRKVVSFGASSSGTMTSTGTISWTSWPGGANGEVISHFSVWDNISAGNCYGSGALAASKTMNTGDQLDLTSITWSLD
jgi:hypothetical protein